MGILLGGHAFDVDPERLRFALILTMATGICLLAVEAGPRLLWFHQGRGLMTFAKLGLLFLVPLAWDYRVPILVAVVVIGSVTSHMPSRYRYYSMLSRTVVQDTSGPGAGAPLDDSEG